MAKAYRKFSEYLGSSLSFWSIDYRVHATRRMFQRRIGEKDARELLETGEVIEEYEEDFPLQSVLVSGISAGKRSLHAVIGIDFNLRRLHIITIYEPDPCKWSKNHRRRLR